MRFGKITSLPAGSGMEDAAEDILFSQIEGTEMDNPTRSGIDDGLDGDKNQNR